MKNKAVLLDRDGTINIDYEYISKVEDFKFLPDSIKALKLLSSTYYKLIIISNQSGIGRGYYTIEDYNKVTNYMLKELKKNNIRIDKIYFCPHAPEENCECRKPNIKMFKEKDKLLHIGL